MSNWTELQTKDLSSLFNNWTHGCAFNPDWTKLYVTWTRWYSNILAQYTLSTPYDLTTATLDTAASWNYWKTIYWTNIFFKSDWTKFYICWTSWNRINEYTMETAWNITGATYQSYYLWISSHSWIYISSDWTKFIDCASWWQEAWIKLSTLSTARDLSSWTTTSSITSIKPTWIWFKPDWSMIFLQFWTNKLSYAELSTPRDLNSIWTLSEVNLNNSSVWKWLYFNEGWTIALWTWWWYVTKYTL